MNERPPGKVVTARPLNALSAIAWCFTCPRFNFAEALVKNVKTDTIWQPTLQRQLGVSMYGGSYVVNWFKEKVVSQKTIVLLP